jgi:hypothetical protein
MGREAMMDDDDTQEYAHQRQWVGLTDVDIHAIWDKDFRGWISRDSMEQIYQAIEAKLKEKNHG